MHDILAWNQLGGGLLCLWSKLPSMCLVLVNGAPMFELAGTARLVGAWFPIHVREERVCRFAAIVAGGLVSPLHDL
jgi:hypothetical protein